MLSEELKKRVVEILNSQAQKDAIVANLWSGSVSSIESVEQKVLRLLSLNAEYRKRRYRKDRKPASKPWTVKTEPWGGIDEWNYFGDWLSKEDGLDTWKDADEFWEACSECDNRREVECTECGGSGRKTCPRCDGEGRIETYI
jgi:hypothetical protein